MPGGGQIDKSIGSSENARGAWQLVTRRGVVPRWVADLAKRLETSSGVSGAIVGGRARSMADERCACWPWWVDSLLFGPAQATLDTDVATVDAERRPSGRLSLLLDDSSSAEEGPRVRFVAGGRPACEVVEAVDCALRRGEGAIELQAHVEVPGAESITISWRAYLDERSRNRSADLAAGKIQNLVIQTAMLLLTNASAWNLKPRPVPRVGLAQSSGTPLYRGVRHALRRLFFREQWAVRIFTDVPANNLLPDGPVIDLVPPRDRFWADPFTVRDRGRLWVFVEELEYSRPKGRISCISIDNTGNASQSTTVLETDCHLSYPNVFQHAGDWYMVPESSARRDVVLYKARSFPERWEPVELLLSGIRMADATLHNDGLRWWMAGTVAAENDCIYDELHLFVADRIAGPWVAVPGNPQRVDAATCRPAGPWFRWNGRLIRPAQDCRGVYGRSVNLMSVDRIGLDGLSESLVATIRPHRHRGAALLHTYARSGRDLAIDWLRWRPPSDLGGRIRPRFELELPDSPVG